MEMKPFFKRVYMKLSPTYRKLVAVEYQTMMLDRKLKQWYSNLEKFQDRNQSMMWQLLAEKERFLPMRESQKYFWSNYPKATGDFAVVQRGNMYLIRCLTKVCDEIGVKFWLHGGSLIGALRHQGFIPRDDDVDVGMLRTDLDKLIRYLDGNREYQIAMAYHDDGTFSRGYQFKVTDESFCCFIDIFPFDYYSGESAEFKSFFLKSRRELVSSFLNMENKPEPEYIASHFAVCNRERCPDIVDIFESALNAANVRNESDQLYYSIECYPFPYPLMQVEDIFPCVKVPFEDFEVNIPANSEQYLKGYGDWWQIPRDIDSSAHFYYYKPHIAELSQFMERGTFE